MTLRADLQRLIDETDEADRRADALVARLTEEQFHWQPDEGRAWSVAQCLDHLATMNVVYTKPIGPAIDAARARGVVGGGPIRPGRVAAWFIRSQEPPVKRRLRSPKQALPASSGTREQILSAFHAAHDRYRDLVRRAAEIDVNRATYPNPFLPLIRMRVGTALSIIPPHDRRHLWQAEQVIARLKAEGRRLKVEAVRPWDDGIARADSGMGTWRSESDITPSSSTVAAYVAGGMHLAVPAVNG